MKKFAFPLLLACLLSGTAFALYNAIDWQITGDYAIRFAGKGVKGVFKNLTGDITFDENNLDGSRFSVTIDVKSISTGNKLKNKHAKSDKWLDAGKFPTIRFTSEKFSKTNSGYQVQGILDLHGVKKTVTIPFTFANNAFKGSFSINRLDYGIGTMKGMSKKVSDEIKLDISVPVTKK